MPEIAFHTLAPDGDCELYVFSTSQSSQNWTEKFDKLAPSSETQKSERVVAPSINNESSLTVKKKEMGKSKKKGKRKSNSGILAVSEPHANSSEVAFVQRLEQVEDEELANAIQASLVDAEAAEAGPSFQDDTTAAVMSSETNLDLKLIDCSGEVTKDTSHFVASSSVEENAPMPLSFDPVHTDFERLRVSSEHLKLSCGYVKRMLSTAMSEQMALRDNGRIRLEFPSFNPVAMLHIMNIIHGRFRQVPKTVHFDILTHVAVLVDFLDCHEAIELFTGLWIEDLRRDIPLGYSAASVQWMFIAQVFGEKKLFNRFTDQATRQGIGPFNDLGLPISEVVVSSIDVHREMVLKDIFSSLSGHIEKLQSVSGICCYECDAMMLGCLIKELTRSSLFPLTSHAAPYWGHSFESIKNTLKTFRQPSWDQGSRSYSYAKHINSIGGVTSAIISETGMALTGVAMI